MKVLSLILLLFFGLISQAQILTIPDANFKNALLNTACVDIDLNGVGDIDADTNNDGEIQLSEAQAITGLVLDHQNIASLEGIENFSEILLLVCYFNDLTTLDVTQNSKLKWLICGANNLSSLDLSQNPDMEQLHCDNNQISSLDLTQNQNLKWFDCWNNQLTSLDVTQNPLLLGLYFASNQLTSIDLTQNPDLETLVCSRNPLIDLDVSQNQNLIVLGCIDTAITELDLSEQPNLVNLRCEFNDFLSSLNIKSGNNTALNTMKANDNPLLTCIQVDDETAEYPICHTNLGWCKDSFASYSENCVLGYEDARQNSFSLYPNPTHDFLMITAQEQIQYVNVYSSQQKLVKKAYTFPIDVSELSGGLYFVEVAMNDKMSTKKFIKY